ncbi:HepT-like ribonuclease domain-containing protein [Paraburkholderia humisilvae]|uniref:DUF86 domain-containing protein n=1 Tax=Paraburkholderia humisilvae TaxID=627669 RepID=A0A6J5F502_9BURK|nr:DUF86 domain-containing protein [Paraburkholderia humisilvae]CAB3772657.1 hypothetical protein LMG29542_06937 [Paraburkholderia humisilvae]
MSNKEPRLPEYLGHIIEAIDRIESYIGNMPEEDFKKNQLLIDAVIRNIEVVGEASNRIYKHHRAFHEAHPEVEWRGSYEMRNVVAHDYFKVDLDVVWEAVKNYLPAMKRAVRVLLLDFNDGEEDNQAERPAVPRPRI